MAKSKVNALMNELISRNEEQRPHVQTIKISESSHAKLRALADFANRNKTPLGADLLMAAIDDAIEALPNDPLEEAVSDKLRGITGKWGVDPSEPYGMRDIVLERAELYLAHDGHGNIIESISPVADVSSSNGVAH
jgi:hypothetical protein